MPACSIKYPHPFNNEHLTSGNWIIAFFAVLAFSVFFLVEYVLGLDGNKSIEILFLINMLFTVTN